MTKPWTSQSTPDEPDSQAADPSLPRAKPATFGSLLHQRRSELGLTLQALAQRADCTKGYLSQLERDHKPPPSIDRISAIEAALGLEHQELHHAAQWHRTPGPVRRDLARLSTEQQRMHQMLDMLERMGLDEAYRSGALAKEVERLKPNTEPTLGSAQRVLPTEVPLINSVTAGYPADFTDLDYPARVADEYVRSPDLADPDAFAARVVGDSMEPDYREGDVVIFSPAASIENGNDCFVRLEPDHETTFKRIYFEQDADGTERIRIQPINNRYPPRIVPRESVAGLYRAAQLLRSVP